ncbi:Signal transduction histidine kinase CheA [Geoglobus acetivorans]|uniref:Chemotaxis protein CheA n=2 Tax=Geoglobus acetivorans TaxID=565033 RepID=A0A0A7GCG0_GEOAI|nr:Signal transduction histidine kinase CheA [Geoglobus acetivorans]
MDEMEQFKEEFIQETREYIDAMNQQFIDLEKGDLQAVNEIFRLAHTIKGMAGFMGYKRVEELCHKLENVMGAVRDGKIQITSDIVDVLLSAIDLLEVLVDKIEEEGNDHQDISQVITELQRILKEDVKIETGGRQKTERIHEDEANIRINITLAEDCVMKSVRALLIIESLKEIGEIVGTVPDEDMMDSERFDGRFTVLMKADRLHDINEVLSKIGEIEKFEVEEIVSQNSKLESKEQVDAPNRKEKSDSSVQTKADIAPHPKKEKKIEFIRVSISQLDTIMNLVGELVINKGRLLQISSDYDIPELKEAVSIMDKIISNLQDEVMEMRMEKVERVFSKFPRMVRDLAKKLGKKVELIMEGLDTELDRTVLDQINDPLIHIVRNCVDHGIEYPDERKASGKSEVGKIRLSAWRDKNYIIIEIEDDGKGLDTEKIKKKAIEKGLISPDEAERMNEDDIKMLIFMPGFSTKEKASEISGRGVGMDVVKTTVEKLGGSVKLFSEKGKGTKIRIQLPPTVAIIKSLLIRVGNETYAIPISNVVEAIYVTSDSVKNIHGSEFLLVRGKLVPVFRLRDLFKINGSKSEKEVGIIVEKENEKYVLIADAITDQQEIVIKPLYGHLAKIKGFNGVTILGDGKVVPILDVSTLIGG